MLGLQDTGNYLKVGAGQPWITVNDWRFFLHLARVACSDGVNGFTPERLTASL